MVGFRGFVEGGSRLWSRGVNGAVSALTRSRVISHIGRVGGFSVLRARDLVGEGAGGARPRARGRGRVPKAV